MRKGFHDASKRAVDARLGLGWTKAEPGPESWSARFEQHGSNAVRVLDLRLSPKRHVVEIVLAVKRGLGDPMPRVWWEDRALHPNETGYAKVLWSGSLTYGSERSIVVPKEFWSSQFATAIERQLAFFREAMESWYADAESEVSTGHA